MPMRRTNWAFRYGIMMKMIIAIDNLKLKKWKKIIQKFNIKFFCLLLMRKSLSTEKTYCPKKICQTFLFSKEKHCRFLRKFYCRSTDSITQTTSMAKLYVIGIEVSEASSGVNSNNKAKCNSLAKLFPPIFHSWLLHSVL